MTTKRGSHLNSVLCALPAPRSTRVCNLHFPSYSTPLVPGQVGLILSEEKEEASECLEGVELSPELRVPNVPRSVNH